MTVETEGMRAARVPRLEAACAAPGRRGAVGNAVFSLAEQFALPLLFVVATPMMAGSLGLERYGIWTLVTAMVGITGAANLGFGDATLRFVSMYRGRGDTMSVIRTLRASLSISLILAAASSLVVFAAAPLVVRLVPGLTPGLAAEAVAALEVAALLIGARTLENVLSASLRGHERYDLAAAFSFSTRALTLLAAVALALTGRSLPEMLLASVAISVLGVLAQAHAVATLAGAGFWTPRWDGEHLRDMFGFGIYSWFQNTSGVIFAHADRLAVAALLGPAAVGVYSICLQVTQQMHALVSAGFAVVFPVVSRCREREPRAALRALVGRLVLGNAGASLALCLPVVLFGGYLLGIWVGEDVRAHGTDVLRVLALGVFVLSANSASHFALLGLGEARFVSFANVTAGALALLVTVLLVPLAGLLGAALGRVAYGLTVSVGLIRLRKALA